MYSKECIKHYANSMPKLRINIFINKTNILQNNLFVYLAFMRQNAYFFLNISFMRKEQVTAY